MISFTASVTPITSYFLDILESMYTNFPICLVRCKQWVQNCRREDLLGKSSAYLAKNCFVCAEHFESQCFPKFKHIRGRMSKGEIPTLFDIPNPPPNIGSKIPAPKPKEFWYVDITYLLQLLSNVLAIYSSGFHQL